MITLKVQIFAGTNFWGNKFLQEFGFRNFDQIRKIRENKFPQNIPKFENSQKFSLKNEMGDFNEAGLHLRSFRMNLNQ